MTITSIDAVISNDRRNLEVVKFARASGVIRASSEFRRFLESALLIGHREGLIANTEEAKNLLETAMVVSIWHGYCAKEQEIGALELEASFNETTNEIPQGIRAITNEAAQGKEVPGVSASGE